MPPRTWGRPVAAPKEAMQQPRDQRRRGSHESCKPSSAPTDHQVLLTTGDAAGLRLIDTTSNVADFWSAAGPITTQIATTTIAKRVVTAWIVALPMSAAACQDQLFTSITIPR